MSTKFHYECTGCGKEYSSEKIIYRCPKCMEDDTAGRPPHGMLKVIYDYAGIRNGHTPEQLFRRLIDERFFPLLPLENPESLGFLKVGNTPVYSVKSMDGHNSGCELLIKDDSQNPTFSFKDRASVIVSAFAKERDINTIITASTGNAGSSLAGICAAQGQKAVILVPATAPVAKLTQIAMYGAVLVPVNANYDKVFELSIMLGEKLGWYNRNTAYNPLTIEGKKTVSFEIAVDTGLQLPDNIFVPCGDGVILAGIYKGFEDLLELGIIEKIPVIVAVQARGSDNLVRNIDSETFRSIPSETIADSISVDIPANFYMARQYIKKYNGLSVVVDDDEILNASRMLSRNTGIFAEPAAAAAFAGLLKMKGYGAVAPSCRNMVLLTGSGLKDVAAMAPVISVPQSLDPDISGIMDFLVQKKIVNN